MLLPFSFYFDSVCYSIRNLGYLRVDRLALLFDSGFFREGESSVSLKFNQNQIAFWWHHPWLQSDEYVSTVEGFVFWRSAGICDEKQEEQAKGMADPATYQ